LLVKVPEHGAVALGVLPPIDITEMKDLIRIYDSRIARMVEQEHELSNSLDCFTHEREKQHEALASSEREKRELELQLKQHRTQTRDKTGLLESELNQANCKLEKQRVLRAVPCKTRPAWDQTDSMYIYTPSVGSISDRISECVHA